MYANSLPIGAQIRYWQESALADKLGVPVMTLYRWERDYVEYLMHDRRNIISQLARLPCRTVRYRTARTKTHSPDERVNDFDWYKFSETSLTFAAACHIVS
ncbi:hypothetical protein ACH6CV_12805 [Bacillota bacterium Meth-B3]